MKKQKKRIRLSTGELELLKVLWNSDGLTIREVQEAINRDVGYTTVQIRLDRLVAKGHAKKKRTKPGRYVAVLKQERVSEDDLNSLVDSVTHGKVIPLIAHLINDRNLTEAEISEVRQLINAAEAKRRKEAQK